MSRRIMKQFLYGVFYSAIWLGVGFFIYGHYVRPAASCVNNRMDTGEEGVDCGGICANVCIPRDVHTIEAIDGGVRVFKSAPRTLELLVRIQNANTQFAARSFRYRFDVKTADGAIVDTVSGESYIYGGEVKYLTAIKTNVNYIPASADFVVESPEWVSAASYPRPDLSGIQDQNVAVATSSISVSGKVTNKDAARLTGLNVVAIFYGSVGMLGTSATELSALAPEETTEFTVLHPNIEGIVPSRTQIIISAQRP
jgi:hypothetical protein